MDVRLSVLIKNAILTIILATSFAQLFGNKIGLMLSIGEPTGIGAQFWLNEKSAIDVLVGWSFGGSGSFHIHSDYLRYFQPFKIKQGTLPIHFGGGARARLGKERNLALRIPIGIMYLFETVPIGILVEVVPMLNLVPDTSFDFNGGPGFVYFFGKE